MVDETLMPSICINDWLEDEEVIKVMFKVMFNYWRIAGNKEKRKVTYYSFKYNILLKVLHSILFLDLQHKVKTIYTLSQTKFSRQTVAVVCWECIGYKERDIFQLNSFIRCQ